MFTGTQAPGTYNPLESLPTRLGLSMRTAEQTNSSGAPMMGATPSTHLGPASFMLTRPAAPHVEAKPSSSAQTGFLDSMYDHLIREMSTTGQGTGVNEEPQDLSLHQLPQGEVFFTYKDVFFTLTRTFF